MRRDRESRFQASHVCEHALVMQATGRSDSGSQAVIRIAIQKLLYKLTITTTWSLSTLDDKSIPTRVHRYRTCYSKAIMKICTV